MEKITRDIRTSQPHTNSQITKFAVAAPRAALCCGAAYCKKALSRFFRRYAAQKMLAHFFTPSL